MRDDSRRTIVILLLILLLALALRLWLWSRPAHPLANDETEYYPVALDLAHGRGFVFYDTYRWLRAPLYPLFLSLWLRLGGDDGRLATLVQVLLSTATVYLLYLLARRLFPRRGSQAIGLVSALLAALLLPLATFPSLFMSETLFTFLLVVFWLLLLAVPAARRRWAWVVGAGVLLGLCALTRSVGLAFLPLAAVWLFFALREKDSSTPHRPGPDDRSWGPLPRATWRRLGWAALLVLAGLLTIAPWTARNALAYGRFIPLDTGASFNLWVFYEPHEDLAEIRRQLEAIPNPADRQAYAMRKGWERIQEDPLILLRKIPRTFPNLVRIKPIEDRFLNAPYREAALPYFLLAMALDDGLYVVITIASLAAFFFTAADRGKTLLLLWLLYNVALMVVLHAEARYRHLLYPALIPYAGLALVQGRRLWAALDRRARLQRMALLLLLLAGWGYTFVAHSPWEWMAVNLERGFHQTAARVNWMLHRREAALASYRRAVEADGNNPETLYDLGWALERLGRTEEAAQAYRWCWDLRATYLPCSTALGNLLRQMGRPEEARQAFQGRFVAEGDVLAWAWDHLRVPAAAEIEIGDGLDYGYVAGMHAPEQVGGAAYRWTTERAWLRLTPPQSGLAQLRLRLAAPRSEDLPPAAVTVWLDGRRLAQWDLASPWQVYETAPFPVRAGEELAFRLESTTFIPQEVDPDSPDTRRLGVQADWAQIVIQITGSARSSIYNVCTPFP